MCKTKKEREEEAAIQIGGKKKGGKKPKRKNDDEEDTFTNIDISLLNLFGFLKVSPPMAKEQLDPKASELKTKLDYFIVEGDNRLREEEE